MREEIRGARRAWRAELKRAKGDEILRKLTYPKAKQICKQTTNDFQIQH